MRNTRKRCATGWCLTCGRRAASRVWGIALSPDERWLASSVQEGTTLLADVQTRQGLGLSERNFSASPEPACR